MPGSRLAALIVGAPVSIAAAVAIGLPTAATAATPQTITFGAPLTQAPGVPFDCTVLPLGDGTTEPFPGGQSSCTWSTPLNPGQPSEGLQTPAGDGTITAVRVWAGARTGPMAFVVLESQTNVLTGAVTCCQVTQVTQPLMPTANKLNTFRTDLPTHTDAPGEQSSPGVQVSDMLGLSILSDGVPIPLVDDTASGQPPSDELMHPAPVQGQTSNATVTSGYQLDLQADWVPGTPAPAIPRVRFASGRTTVRRGRVHLPLRCRRDVCKGTISIATARPRVTLAGGSFRIGQNLYRSIAVPLTADGKAAVRRHQQLDVSVEVTYQTPSARKTISRRITLRF
jgi:hypothetical protein